MAGTRGAAARSREPSQARRRLVGMSQNLASGRRPAFTDAAAGMCRDTREGITRAGTRAGASAPTREGTRVRASASTTGEGLVVLGQAPSATSRPAAAARPSVCTQSPLPFCISPHSPQARPRAFAAFPSQAYVLHLRTVIRLEISVFRVPVISAVPVSRCRLHSALSFAPLQLLGGHVSTTRYECLLPSVAGAFRASKCS
jgi:hypothetical protein